MPHQERDRNRLTCQLANPKSHHGCSYTAVRTCESVGVNVARYCLLKFGTVLRDHQLIHAKMLGFAVELQSETIRQKLLKHVLPLTQALILAELLQRIKHRFVYLRFNVVSFRVEPVRCSRDLIVFDSVRLSNEHLQSQVGRRETIGLFKQLLTDHPYATFAWFD